MSCSSATEAGVAWFCLASGTVHVGVDRIGSLGSAVVSSSSAPSAKCASSPYVHWDWDIVHATRRVGGVKTVRVLIIECSVRVALEILLEICERAATEPSRLKLWARHVGCVTALLFQYIVEEFLAPSDLYGTLFQLGEVTGLWPFDDVFQDMFW